jgi:hypothetical protein
MLKFSSPVLLTACLVASLPASAACDQACRTKCEATASLRHETLDDCMRRLSFTDDRFGKGLEQFDDRNGRSTGGRKRK